VSNIFFDKKYKCIHIYEMNNESPETQYLQGYMALYGNRAHAQIEAVTKSRQFLSSVQERSHVSDISNDDEIHKDQLIQIRQQIESFRIHVAELQRQKNILMQQQANNRDPRMNDRLKANVLNVNNSQIDATNSIANLQRMEKNITDKLNNSARPFIGVPQLPDILYDDNHGAHLPAIKLGDIQYNPIGKCEYRGASLHCGFKYNRMTDESVPMSDEIIATTTNSLESNTIPNSGLTNGNGSNGNGSNGNGSNGTNLESFNGNNWPGRNASRINPLTRGKYNIYHNNVNNQQIFDDRSGPREFISNDILYGRSISRS